MEVNVSKTTSVNVMEEHKTQHVLFSFKNLFQKITWLTQFKLQINIKFLGIFIDHNLTLDFATLKSDPPILWFIEKILFMALINEFFLNIS